MNETKRYFSATDNFILQVDTALNTLLPFRGQPFRPSPAEIEEEATLSPQQAKHVAALMRINHTGEVCAQALYQGQALTATLNDTRKAMEHAAVEEVDHLAWCEQRVKQLNSHTSLLNPLFYGLSFSIGALAGVISDKVSLGFVAATEEQVVKHLDSHLQQIPESDMKSRSILKQMHTDELRHANTALAAGGFRFPRPIKFGMSVMSKVMTFSTYRI
ncbi:UNVERIFIED_CONTAM: hypothetical protein GTU68_036779 [Idotea baltica]|nr:hypothetical protein [Idotea baltica]